MNKDRSMLLCRGHIGKMELKNRIIMAPMGTTADGDGGYSARTIRYFTERAKGGTGLIITGRNASVLEFEGYSCSALSNYHHVNRLAALADRVRLQDLRADRPRPRAYNVHVRNHPSVLLQSHTGFLVSKSHLQGAQH